MIEKEKMVDLLHYNRNKFKDGHGVPFWDWVKQEISKFERCTCCYSLGHKSTARERFKHMTTEWHVRRLVEKHGVNNKRLLKECKEYLLKMMYIKEREDNDIPF